MRRIRPNLLVLAELELWPNLIVAAKAFRAKVAVINGRLSERSFRGYRRVGWLARRTLSHVDLIAAQSPEYAERFRELGARAERVFVTGSIKFDGAASDRKNPLTQRLAALAGIQGGDFVFLAGSTQHPEEQLAIDVFRRVAADHPQLRLILVPRHPERFDEVARLLDKSGLAWQRRSSLDPSPKSKVQSPKSGAASPTLEFGLGTSDSPPGLTTHPILLVDAVGELAGWWGTAHVGFVGGSLGNRGGQNMIEPAAYGAAVCFGPNTWNFRDVVALLLSHDAARVVRGAADLESFLRRCLDDAPFAHALGALAQDIVQKQSGAADRTIDLLLALSRAEKRIPLAA
jgi:3-deoxy-D-manno-octulosonic-acid transferase